MDVFQTTKILPSAFNKILISLPRFIRHLTKSDRDIIIRNISLSCRVAWRSIGHRVTILFTVFSEEGSMLNVSESYGYEGEWSSVSV